MTVDDSAFLVVGKSDAGVSDRVINTELSDELSVK